MKLKIFKQNPWLEQKHPTEIMSTAVEVLNGITKKEPEFSKGKKLRTDFVISDTDEIAISQVYSDILDENGFLIGTKMRIEWYDENGNVALIKDVHSSL